MTRSLLLTLALLLIAAPAWAQRKPVRTATTTITSPPEYLQKQRKAGTPVETVVADLRTTYRQSLEQATMLLRDAGYAAAETAQGLTRGERLPAAKTAALLWQAKYPAIEVAEGVMRSRSLSKEAAYAALIEAKIPMQELSLVATKLGVLPTVLAQAMKDDGARIEEVAQMLKNQFGLSANETAVLLKQIGFPTYRIADALADAGYVVPKPGMLRYRIAEYRPGQSQTWLYNDGIINRSKSKDDFLEAGDGTVFIEGTNLNDPDVEVFVSSRGTSFPAEVLERTSSGGEDVIKARFTNLHGGDLVVRTLTGGRAAMPAKALSFWVTDDNLLDGEIAGLEIRLADEQPGAGTVVFNGSFGSSSEPIAVPPFEQPGLTVNLVDMRSQAPTLTMTSVGDGQLLMKVEVPFETTGRELQGTILEEITAWTCSSFQIDETECSPFGLGCITTVLGSAFASAGQCTNPANWQETTVQGPAVPFEGDLTNPQLTIQTTLGTTFDGKVEAEAVEATLAAGISIATPVADVPLFLIETWITQQINDQIAASLADLDVGTKFAAPLETYRSTVFKMPLRGLYAAPGNRLLLDSAERY